MELYTYLIQGSVKMAGNYSPVLGPSAEAKAQGYTVLLFLDPKTNEYVEEFGTSNFAGSLLSRQH
jgi:branched-chain amino acid aminotransferase